MTPTLFGYPAKLALEAPGGDVVFIDALEMGPRERDYVMQVNLDKVLRSLPADVGTPSA
jgi:hypothetical protein